MRDAIAHGLGRGMAGQVEQDPAGELPQRDRTEVTDGRGQIAGEVA
jgi:hypothetical protein